MSHIDMLKRCRTRLKGPPGRLIFLDLGVDCLTARQYIFWFPRLAMRRDTFLVATTQHAHTAVFRARYSQCDPNGVDLAAIEPPMRGILVPEDEPSVARLLRVEMS